MRKIYLALLLLATGLFITGKSYAQPSITYTPVSPSCVGSDVSINGVTIADGTGVTIAGANKPRVYFRKSTGSWMSSPGTLVSGDGTSGTWDFTISASMLGGLAATNTLLYYVVAESGGGVTAEPGAGFSATDVNTITSHPSSPNSFVVSSYPSVAGLYATPNFICVGNEFTLSTPPTVGTGAIVSYNWTGPNGYSTTSTTPSVVLTPTTTAATGMYYVSVTYEGDGCTSGTRNAPATVYPALPGISGASEVCEGATSSYVIGTTGGTFVSSDPSIASINYVNGTLTGVSAGEVTISYIKGTCFVTKDVTINAVPSAIAGDPYVCLGSTSALSNASPGGLWSSDIPAIASVDGVGLMTGNAIGTTVVSYTFPTGCAATLDVSVNVVPAPLTGIMEVCEGSTTNLASSPYGGTWSSGNTAVASVGLSSGSVAGVAAGTATISYVVGGVTGCVATDVVTVNPLPAPITGSTSVCFGSTTSLSSMTAGGTWSSGNLLLASVDASGIVSAYGVGTVPVSYTLGTGCARSVNVVVNATPPAIALPHEVCVGSNLYMSGVSGTWSSSDPSTATITPTTAVVTGVSAGTVIISNINTLGCYRTAVYTVNPVPAAITGDAIVCTGTTHPYSNVTPGGLWTSSNSSVLSIVAATGEGTSGIAGITSIRYTLGTGCSSSYSVTVSNTPGPILGPNSLCVGGLITVTNSLPSGTWSSDNTAVATIAPITGAINGVSAGTANITYTSAAGCIRSKEITVFPNPPAITGTMEVCQGLSTVLANGATGGVWYSSATGIATINSVSGTVVGVSGGTATMYYQLPTGCRTSSDFTVNPTPAAISGSSAICLGSTASFTSTTPGGIWSSGNPAVGTVSGSGVLTGVAVGTTRISYTTSSGCTTSKIVTVNALPSSIAGSLVVCSGSTTVLTNLTTGGAWSSSDLGVASVNAFGTVSGVSAGIANITYTLSSSCYTTAAVTVNPIPDAITGSMVACMGDVSVLSTSSTGGTWNSSSPAVATVDASGTVTALAPGTSVIAYTYGSGCETSTVFTVNAPASTISGFASVCEGLTGTLYSTPGGGSWSTSNPSVATVSGGVFTGIGAGTCTISYTLGTGCSSTREVTVTPSPVSSTGNLNVCIGGTSTLSNATGGGDWTSSNSAIASVDPTTGVVTGVNVGVANITYTLSTGCRTISSVTVNGSPATISGTATTCIGSATTLACSTVGGSWSSSNTTVATVGTGSGVVLGLSEGATIITYTVGATGCYRTRTVNVFPVPAAITGPTEVCAGLSITLASATLGGLWSSGNTAVATVGAVSGVVSGLSSGNVNMTYTMASGCSVARAVTVNPLPAALTGSSSVCVGATTVFSSTTSGGTWSSSNNLIATVGTNGLITGVSNGSAFITYSTGSGCFIVRAVNVNSLPSPIAGNLSLCEGATTNLSSLSPGGTWTSSSVVVATIGYTSGIVSGINGGTSTITYTTSSGCTVTAIVTVNTIPTSISGITTLCMGSSSTLSSLTAGGSWSSSNPLIASIGAGSGIVTGNAVGSALITYLLPTGCRTTTPVTVGPVPANITGVAVVCEGGTTTLTSVSGGGSWSSEDNTIATINSAGLVNGISSGTVVISYTTAIGCAKTRIVTVNALPDPIGGSAAVCAGNTTTLTNATSGGVWQSSNASVATIDVTTGDLNGLAPGTCIISYSMPTGCRTFVVATVYPLPTPITGLTNICTGSSVLLSNGTADGIWSSDNGSITVIEPGTGLLTGTGPGIDTVRYTVTGGCQALITVTVTPAPPPISGDLNLCAGETSLLTNPVAGGSWSSSNPTVATIDLGSGLLTSLTEGSTTVTYTLGAGCKVFAPVNVNRAPSPITGPTEVCMGHTVTLYNSVADGTWSSTDASVASVFATTGIVTGVANNTVTIKYELPGGCFASFAMTVNATPPPIGGIDSVCKGLTTTLTNSLSSGIWTSSDPSIAPVDLFTGVVTGVNDGTATISYTLLGTGCYRRTEVTVNPTPEPITGTTNVCVGSFTVLNTASVGGTWSSSNLTVATVGSGTGIVSGLDAGSATITYTLPSGCIATTIVVVNPLPDVVVGADELCVGSATTYTNSTPYGTWSSSIPSAVSIVETSGEATGIVAGTSTISYTLLSTGCYTTKQVSINPLPPPILGNPNVCLGNTTFLTNASSGGTWSSSAGSVATIDAFGNVTSVGAGTTTITYTIGTACYITQEVNVEPTLNPITGPTNVCEFADVTLLNDYSGGIWTSSDIATVTVGSTGVATGVAAGTATISYATPLAGCYTTRAITVDPVPMAIVGDDTVCEASTFTLTNATPGGTWSSSDVTVATIDGSGTVTGVSGNTATISYIVGSGCFAVREITVNPLADAGDISGPSELCITTNISLASSSTGGVWSSSDATIASVSTTGEVTGEAVGTATISYIVTNFCSADTAVYNVLVKPAADAGTLSGATELCINYSTTLSSTVSGGLWSSSDTTVAVVDAVGNVTSLSAGTTTISYLVTTDCGSDISTVTFTVHTMAPHTDITIHPDDQICANSFYLNFGAASAPDTGMSYTWTAENAEVYATSSPDKQRALVNFINPGTATVRLTTQIVSTGCFVVDSFVATVNASDTVMPEISYYGDELVCSDNTLSSYQWGYDEEGTLDSVLLPGEIMQSLYLPVPDFTGRKYWVMVERGGCYHKVYYNAPANVGPVSIRTLGMVLFPNPANSTVNIEVKGITGGEQMSVRLIDMMGKELQNVELANGKGSINVSNLASGVYSVMLLNDGVKVASRTFVKN